MYLVSEAYLERMMHHGTRRRLTGTIGSVPFSNDDVIRDSLIISANAADASNMKIGGVYLGEFSMSFVPSFISKVDRDEYSGKEVSISIGLWIPDPEDEIDGGEWVDVPCGVFTLDEESPQLSKNGIAVTGYDHMKKFDKKIDLDTTSATPYGYLTFVCNACGVELGNTQEEIEALPNGTELLGLYSPNDIETYRDLLYWLAQSCACFACCDRTGKLVLRKFGNPTGITFDEDHRDDDVVFSGYTTKWTGVSFVDMQTQMTRYYGLEVDDGLTMNLGSNPLLQIGSVDAIDRRRRAVLQGVSEIQYTPFSFNSARDPIFDLGDEIPFTGGLSGNCTGCVMSLNYTLSNYNFEGYGDKPSLANARSKADKDISGLIQETTENQVTYYQFANVEPISIVPEQEVSIAKLKFVSAQPTTVKILHEFIFDMLADLASDGSYELRYYLDDELLTYKPYERLGGIYGGQSGNTELSICRDFFYILKDVEPNLRHEWEVKIVTHGISSTMIKTNNAHIVIEGQRLYSDDYFDGYIEAEDILTIIPLGYLGVVSIVDAALISLIESKKEEVSDNVGLYNFTSMNLLPIAEGTGDLSPHIFFQLEPGDILTEDGDNLTTEDGDNLVL